jgi:hypothetical protein
MTLPVLYRHHFQLGYVVRNIEGAMETMRKRLGVTEWEVRRPAATAPARTLAFAWVDQLMVELVDVRPGEDTIYHAWIPETDDGLRLQHLGYLIDDEAEWHAAIRQYEDAGIPCAIRGGEGGPMEWYYADTLSVLGHYSELVHFTSDAGRAYWANVPRN